ncbi:putative hydrolase, haloacid dehydrogenase(HAD) superfamily protein [Mycobacteroides abscessus subsp. massiliense]|nr:putative hydrolase, haloacid dehydrogenase(HAD) superfamily protein [Mycobacteroides abscessus subsp. massiliense]
MANENVEVDQPVSKENFDNIVDYCRDKNFLVLTYDNGYIIHDSSHEYMNIESQLTGLPMNRVADLKEYLEEVIVFGDSLNDKSMFEVAGYSVAMGNASDELKKIADEVTLDNNSNGIPYALKEILV